MPETGNINLGTGGSAPNGVRARRRDSGGSSEQFDQVARQHDRPRRAEHQIDTKPEIKGVDPMVEPVPDQHPRDHERQRRQREREVFAVPNGSLNDPHDEPHRVGHEPEQAQRHAEERLFRQRLRRVDHDEWSARTERTLDHSSAEEQSPHEDAPLRPGAFGGCVGAFQTLAAAVRADDDHRRPQDCAQNMHRQKRIQREPRQQSGRDPQHDEAEFLPADRPPRTAHEVRRHDAVEQTQHRDRVFDPGERRQERQRQHRAPEAGDAFDQMRRKDGQTAQHRFQPAFQIRPPL